MYVCMIKEQKKTKRAGSNAFATLVAGDYGFISVFSHVSLLPFLFHNFYPIFLTIPII